MSQSKIAAFFRPKAAKLEAEEAEKRKQAEVETTGDTPMESEETPPSKEKAEFKKVTPPTRKRLRQLDSDESGEDEDAAPPKRDKSQEKTHTMEVEKVSASPRKHDQDGKDSEKSEPVDGEKGKEEKAVEQPAEPAKESIEDSENLHDRSKKAVPEKKVPSMFAKAEPKKAKVEPSKAEEKVKEKVQGRNEEVGDKDEDSDAEAEHDVPNTKDALSTLMKSAGKFDAAKLASWKKGQPVPYTHLATTFDKVAATTKRLEITSILTEALRTVIEISPEDLLPCVYLCVNKLAPAHEGIELGLGDQVLKKAIAEATGRQERDIKSDYEKAGDLGIVATESRGKQRTMFAAKALTVQHVHKTLLQIAKTEGKNSMTFKKDKVKALLVASKGSEALYVVRHLQGKMRIGLAEQTVLVALAHALALSPPTGKACNLETAVEIVKEVFSQLPCYDKIIPEVLKSGLTELPNKCFLVPGIPVKPMLAHPTKGISEVLNRFADKEFTCEYKYDGERGQIHRLEDGTFKIFSRNSEDNTSKYPDIIKLVPEVVKEGVTSFVLDAEVVAYDRETKKILPFQVLSTRKRKEAEESEIKVQVCIFAFDILYLNGEPLLKQPFKERREKLYSSFSCIEGSFGFATSRDANDVEQIQEFLDDAIRDSCEGLMVKTLTDQAATYEPDKRSHKWLKVKKDYIAGMTDTLDLVPIGAWYGKGKRTGTFGAYLLACYDDDTEEFQTITKIGTGFSDQQLKDFHSLFQPYIAEGPKPYYQWEDTPKDKPDVWFEAKVVWEVAAADLSISPVHKAGIGMVDDAKGIALRFPRLIRVREDKNPEQATNASQVAAMYRNQAVIDD